MEVVLEVSHDQNFYCRSLVRVTITYLSLIFLIGNEQAIAHTFCVLILHWRGPEYISKLVVLMIWGFTALVIAIPYRLHRNERYYGEAGYCKSCIVLVVVY